MIKIIAACSQNGVIGVYNNNKGIIPFRYKEDLKQFKRLTEGNTVVMGRRTYDSIGKPLSERNNIVISSNKNLIINGAVVYDSLEKALTNDKDIWIIGGAAIYQKGMKYADEIHLTISPDYIEHDKAIMFPWINPNLFEIKSKTVLHDKVELSYVIYNRIKN
jgi:dihydrofolate reductase